MTPLSDDAIHQFWQWLVDNQDRVQGYLEAKEAIKVAAAFCRSVDLILGKEWKWEVGPSATGVHEWFFALSPGGNRKRLEETRRAVSMASGYALNWEILPSKPRRDLGQTLEMLAGNQEGAYLDLANWEYQLVSYNQREFFDIFLAPSHIHPVNGLDAYKEAAWILVDALLGEEFVIEKIGAVNVVPREELNRANDVKHLHAHLASILDQ